MADQCACTGRKAQEETDKHIDDRTHRADGGKGVVADKITYDPGIHRVIKLLKKITDQKRKSKGYELSGDTTLCHIHAVPADRISFSDTKQRKSFSH